MVGLQMAHHEVVDFLDAVLLHEVVDAVHHLAGTAVEQHGFAGRRHHEGHIDMADIDEIKGGLRRGGCDHASKQYEKHFCHRITSIICNVKSLLAEIAISANPAESIENSVVCQRPESDDARSSFATRLSWDRRLLKSWRSGAGSRSASARNLCITSTWRRKFRSLAASEDTPADPCRHPRTRSYGPPGPACAGTPTRPENRTGDRSPAPVSAPA